MSQKKEIIKGVVSNLITQKKKEKKRKVCVYIDPEILKKLKLYSFDNRVSMGQVIEKLLREFLKEN